MTIKRAFSVIRFKAVEEGDERIIEGMATTPTPDRVGDIVDPMGAVFADDLPLHLYHDATLPVGRVKFGRATRKGIPFKASLPKVEEAGTVRDRIDEAWHSLKYKLISAVSIGFRIMYEAGEDAIEFLEGGGVKFLKTEILELSLVSVPANPDAVVTGVKSVDNELRAALGQQMQRRVVKLDKLTASVLAQRPTEKGKEMKIQETIKSFEAKRAALTDRLATLMELADNEGRTLDEKEEQEYKDLETEVDTVDSHLVRLRKLEKLQVKAAKPIKDVEDADDPEEDAAKLRSPHIVSGVEKKQKPGIEFARYVMCLGAAKGNLETALAIARNRFKDSPRVVSVLKSAVAAGTTTDATWAGPLLEYNQFTGDFIEFLRPQTIIGKFGTDGIPSLRQVPFNINVPAQTSGGAGYWVGQGAPKPLTKFDFTNIYLGYTKVAGIAVLTEELLRFSKPNAEVLVRDALRDALVERLDTDFVDPAKAAVANVSPASIINGVTPVTAAGTGTIDNIRTDVKAIMGKYIAVNITPASGVWIMSATMALSLSLMVNALGQKEHPDITMVGGKFMGLPVIVSEYMTKDSGGEDIILVNASDIYLADDGLVTIDASREASLQMDNAPSNNSSTGTGASMVSMFQTNSVALRAERYIHWMKRRAAAAQYIADAKWGA